MAASTMSNCPSPTLSKYLLNLAAFSPLERALLSRQSIKLLVYSFRQLCFSPLDTAIISTSLFLSRWHSSKPVAPAAVDTTTFSPFLASNISRPAKAASPLLMRQMKLYGPNLSTSFLSITKHSLCLCSSNTKQLTVPVFPKTYSPTGQLSSLLLQMTPTPKQLKTSPLPTCLQLVFAPDSHTLITGSTENASTLTTVASAAKSTLFSVSQKCGDSFLFKIRISFTLLLIQYLMQSYLPQRSNKGPTQPFPQVA